MTTSGSVNSVARRLRWWANLKQVGWCLLGPAIYGAFGTRGWMLIGTLVVVVTVIAIGGHLIREHAPASLRWLTTRSRRSFAPKVGRRRSVWRSHASEVYRTPEITESFEIDLCCAKCGAPNIGTEAGEWQNGARLSVFRSCNECGLTEWWSERDNPPRVRRRLRTEELENSCRNCGYSLVGVPVKSEDRGSDRVAYVQQCPECGRAEFLRRKLVAPGNSA